MTAQDAAQAILTEFGKAMSASEIAQVALQRELLRSFARDPVRSIAETLKKNVRVRSRNRPELTFVYESGHRLLGLPEWDHVADHARSEPESSNRAELKVHIHTHLLDQVQLAVQSRIAGSFENTVALLLRHGLAAEAAHIRERLLEQLDNLDSAIPVSEG